MLAAVKQIEVPLGSGAVSASVHGSGATALVLGHGAGGDRRSPLLVRLAERLAGPGRQTVLYNFPYSEARRKLPDRPETLEATCRAVGEHVRRTLGASRVVQGGKSMGGRIASQAVAKGAPADALVFLGYPLHPPGRPHQLRDGHLPGIDVPMLFLQGTRDAFARWDLIEALAARLGPRATLHRLEGADHSFGVPRKSGRSSAEVETEIVGTILGWLGERAT